MSGRKGKEKEGEMVNREREIRSGRKRRGIGTEKKGRDHSAIFALFSCR